ncbi:hypothetical protein ES705_38579 [subsurface metagenome]
MFSFAHDIGVAIKLTSATYRYLALAGSRPSSSHCPLSYLFHLKLSGIAPDVGDKFAQVRTVYIFGNRDELDTVPLQFIFQNNYVHRVARQTVKHIDNNRINLLISDPLP